MPMSPRLLRPIASGVHPEAAAWRSAVVANGGSVSSSTIKAVSTFCAAIDAAGLRDRFYRLNLFCGDSDASLIAPRVPLYRGPSRTGTQYGNALDTNNNFVQGDYAETGSGGGLDGNGTSKYLDTGFNANTGLPSSVDTHISYSGTGLETSGDRLVAGSFTGVALTGAIIASAYDAFTASRMYRIGRSNDGVRNITPTSSESHYLASRTSSTSLVGYSGGAVVGTYATATTPVFLNGSIYVFCLNNNGTAGLYTDATLRMYSVGVGMDGTQALAFYNAVEAFNTALGRA